MRAAVLRLQLTRQLRAHETGRERVGNGREMNAEEVLDNWSDIESEDSDVSSDDESGEEREDASDEEDDDNRQTWREATGLWINISL